MVISNLKRAFAISTLALAGLAGYAGTGWLAVQHGGSAVSTAAVLTAHTTIKPTPDRQADDACHALASYDARPSAARLERLIAEASYLPGKSYLKADIFEYVADLTSPGKNAPEYASVADQYAGEDCDATGTSSGGA